jgi:serine/threonine-protein kinase
MTAVAAPPAPVWQRALPWTMAVLAILAAAAMAWTSWSRPAAPARHVTRAKYPLSDLSGFVALARDGTKLAYTVSGAQGFYIALRQMDQFEAKPLPGSEKNSWPLFSPDGEWIAFSSVSAPAKIRKIPIAGGTSSTLCDGSFQQGGAWGDDDTIVFPGGAGLMRVSANGGTPAPLTKLDAAKGENRTRGHSFSPTAGRCSSRSRRTRRESRVCRARPEKRRLPRRRTRRRQRTVRPDRPFDVRP